VEWKGVSGFGNGIAIHLINARPVDPEENILVHLGYVVVWWEVRPKSGNVLVELELGHVNFW
jgi:hypothetical protein